MVAPSGCKSISGGKSYKSSNRSKSLDFDQNYERVAYSNQKRQARQTFQANQEGYRNCHNSLQSQSLKKERYAEAGKGRTDYILRFNQNSGLKGRVLKTLSSPSYQSVLETSNGYHSRIRSSSPR